MPYALSACCLPPWLDFSASQAIQLTKAMAAGRSSVALALIEAGAPLDHINNLGWTALIEAVVLGDGGPDHVRTARLLVESRFQLLT